MTKEIRWAKMKLFQTPGPIPKKFELRQIASNCVNIGIIEKNLHESYLENHEAPESFHQEIALCYKWKSGHFHHEL